MNKVPTYVIEVIKTLKNKGFEFIVITNQGGISKQLYNHNDVFNVHAYMQQVFKQAGIPLLAIYYCPHHSFIEKCICHKALIYSVQYTILFYIQVRISIDL